LDDREKKISLPLPLKKRGKGKPSIYVLSREGESREKNTKGSVIEFTAIRVVQHFACSFLLSEEREKGRRGNALNPISTKERETGVPLSFV